jgi:hypothetical protein
VSGWGDAADAVHSALVGGAAASVRRHAHAREQTG